MAKVPEYQIISGLKVPTFYDPDIVRCAMDYWPDEDDIIVSGYPKCGSSYVSQIVQLILNNGQQCYSADEYFTSIPLLEMVGTDNLCYMPRPRCIKTHLPLNRINFRKCSKYIYVARHYSECILSYYKHTKMFPPYFFTDGTFDDFLDLFIKGEVFYNEYISHFGSGYSKRWYKNVLFITYEKLTLNLKDSILKIASFLGENYVRNLKMSGEKVLKEILFLNSSFMKTTVDEFWKELFVDKPLSENCQIHFPIANKYANVMKEAENNGHFLRDDIDEVTLTKIHTQKLDKYLTDNVWIEGSAIWNYLMKKEITC